MSFSLDMSNFVKKAGENADKVVRATTIGLFSAVIDATPIKTGRAQGAWMFSTNEFDNTIPEDTRRKSDAQNAVDVGAHAYKAGDSLMLSNNLGYIIPLEYGWSKQAPSGMARLNIMKFQTFVNNASKGLS